MQIYVCVKHVPDSAAHIHIVGRNGIDETVAFLLNPFDEHALTEAERIRQSLPGSEIVAVCLGKEDAEKTLRSSLAMGADRGLLIASDQRYDSIETARILKSAIEQDGTPDLILTGKESIDAEGMQTMFRIGALFDFPVVNNVVKLDIADGKAVVDTDLSSGIVDTYELSLPCVIGAGKGLNTPRYPTFPDVVKSKKKPVKTIRLDGLQLDTAPAASRMTLVELAPLKQKREPKEIIGDPGAVAREMVRILKQEAKVI